MSDLKPSRKGIGGRPRKAISNQSSPALLKFLNLFGLQSWDDTKSWTQKDIEDSDTINEYFKIRSELLQLSYPKNDIRKIKISDPDKLKPKDLITLLGQFARLYGYRVISYTKDVKPSKTNGLTKKRCFQIYSLTRS